MFGSEHLFTDLKCALIKRLGLGILAGLAIKIAEIIKTSCSLDVLPQLLLIARYGGTIRTVCFFGNGERTLVKPFRLRVVAHVLINQSEFAQSRSGIGMILTQRVLPNF